VRTAGNDSDRRSGDLELHSASEDERQPDDRPEIEAYEDDFLEDDSSLPSDDGPVILNPRAGFLPLGLSNATKENTSNPDVGEDDSATGQRVSLRSF
jgi:hypothetical protein